MRNEQIKAALAVALNFDAVDVAEKALKTSPRLPVDQNMLALSLQFANSQRRRELLTQLGDTTFANRMDRYVEIITKFGFEMAQSYPFTRKDRTSPDHLYVYMEKTRGLLLVFDTYHYEVEDSDEDTPISVNGSTLYYTWKPNDPSARNHCTSSGGMESAKHPNWRRDSQFYKKDEDGDKYISSYPDDLVWKGYHDGREALLYVIEQLEQHGTFVAPWPNGYKGFYNPFIVEADYALHTNYHSPEAQLTRDEVQVQRIALLPDWCKQIIGA